jgi:hypothetical protein
VEHVTERRETCRVESVDGFKLLKCTETRELLRQCRDGCAGGATCWQGTARSARAHSCPPGPSARAHTRLLLPRAALCRARRHREVVEHSTTTTVRPYDPCTQAAAASTSGSTRWDCLNARVLPARASREQAAPLGACACAC